MLPNLLISLPGALGGPMTLQAWASGPNGLCASAGQGDSTAKHAFCRHRAWDLLDDVAGGCSGFDDWADTVAQKFTDCAQGHRLTILGYSMGARLLLYLLSKYPNVCAAAVIISGHPGLDNPADCLQRRNDDAEWAARARQMPWQEFLQAWETRPIFACGIPQKQWRSDLASAWQEERRAQEARRHDIARSLEIWSLGSQPNLVPHFTSIPTPILWLTGDHDSKFTQLAASACTQLPSAAHHTIAYAGHRLPWEAPATTTTLIRQFMAGNLD